jgi:hypothetical protein
VVVKIILLEMERFIELGENNAASMKKRKITFDKYPNQFK